ncbi:RhuM family protein, partial [Phascolarctobacterium succinatutens]|uniref:RhuM family protein n=1 Tax=Phascolarctobacterium succinatutens TaxID=626940 RepID=UPI003F7D051E
DNGTVWLTQAQIAELFNKERSGISKHIKKFFNEGELYKKSNVNFLHIANSNKPLAFYSLDVILAVGFRVRSPRSTQFRHRANNTFSVNPTDYLKKYAKEIPSSGLT